MQSNYINWKRTLPFIHSIGFHVEWLYWKRTTPFYCRLRLVSHPPPTLQATPFLTYLVIFCLFYYQIKPAMPGWRERESLTYEDDSKQRGPLPIYSFYGFRALPAICLYKCTYHKQGCLIAISSELSVHTFSVLPIHCPSQFHMHLIVHICQEQIFLI
jgi:hypothetical protein